MNTLSGKEFFEKNFHEALNESLHSFEEDFACEKITWRDSNGKEVHSTLAFAKDLEDLATKVIEEEGIKNYRIVFSFDGGQSKCIVTMTIFDMVHTAYSTYQKSSIFCFAQLLLQILVNFQNLGQVWNLLIIDLTERKTIEI